MSDKVLENVILEHSDILDEIYLSLAESISDKKLGFDRETHALTVALHYWRGVFHTLKHLLSRQDWQPTSAQITYMSMIINGGMSSFQDFRLTNHEFGPKADDFNNKLDELSLKFYHWSETKEKAV